MEEDFCPLQGRQAHCLTSTNSTYSALYTGWFGRTMPREPCTAYFACWPAIHAFLPTHLHSTYFTACHTCYWPHIRPPLMLHCYGTSAPLTLAHLTTMPACTTHTTTGTSMSPFPRIFNKTLPHTCAPPARYTGWYISGAADRATTYYVYNVHGGELLPAAIMGDAAALRFMYTISTLPSSSNVGCANDVTHRRQNEGREE